MMAPYELHALDKIRQLRANDSRRRHQQQIAERDRIASAERAREERRFARSLLPLETRLGLELQGDRGLVPLRRATRLGCYSVSTPMLPSLQSVASEVNGLITTVGSIVDRAEALAVWDEREPDYDVDPEDDGPTTVLAPSPYHEGLIIVVNSPVNSRLAGQHLIEYLALRAEYERPTWLVSTPLAPLSADRRLWTPDLAGLIAHRFARVKLKTHHDTEAAKAMDDSSHVTT
jgi:hypothetical protein